MTGTFGHLSALDLGARATAHRFHFGETEPKTFLATCSCGAWSSPVTKETGRASGAQERWREHVGEDLLGLLAPAPGPEPLAPEKAAELDEIRSDAAEWDETDVAVVVFVRSRGYDSGDAENRAVLAVQAALFGPRGGERGEIDLLHQGHVIEHEGLPVVDVTRLRATDFTLTPESRPFRQAGLAAPRRKDRA